MYGSYKISTPPASEPVTLSEAKTHLRVDVSTDDTYITTLITAARQIVEKYLNRALINTTYTVLFDRLPTCIKLLYSPVSSVTSISYKDTAGASQTLNSSLYVVDTHNEPGQITPAYGADYPSTYGQADAVTVTYVAGYGASASDVPDAIKQMILILIGDMYDNRTSQVRQKMTDLMDFYIQQYKVSVLAE